MKHISEKIAQALLSTLTSLRSQGILTSEPSAPKTAPQKLALYLELLAAWSPKLDLVGPGDPDSLIQRHFCDGFATWALLSQLGLFQLGPCMDVGSGAGLPGIVLATLAPSTQFILCEPREKRTIFLKEVKRRAELSNCEILRARMEEVEPEKLSHVSSFVFRALYPDTSIVSHLRKVAGARLVFTTGSDPIPPEGVAWERSIEYRLAHDTRGRQLKIGKIK